MAVREDRMTWLGSMVRVMVQVLTDAKKDSTKQLFVSHYTMNQMVHLIQKIVVVCKTLNCHKKTLCIRCSSRCVA